MDFVLHNTALANLIAAVVVLATGLAIYYLSSHRVFELHRYTRSAFEYWLLQWSAFVLIYIIYRVFPHSSPLVLVGAADLQSVLALGFFAAMFRGSGYRLKDIAPSLTILFVLLTLWNVGVGGMALQTSVGSLMRRAWVLPSEITSASTLALIAAVFLWRWGYPAISIAVTLAIYLILQQPVYETLFVTPRAQEPLWLLALAIGKLFYGGLVYTLFFLPARHYGHLTAPTFGIARPSLQRVVHSIITIVGGIAGHFIAVTAYEAFSSLKDQVIRLPRLSAESAL